MRIRAGREETAILVSSAAGRDTGLFLIFVAVVGTWPVQYIWEATFNAHFIAVQDWTAAQYASLILLVGGGLLMFNTHKRIRVKDGLLEVRDAWWRRALRFSWKAPCSIKLRAIETEVRHRVLEVWQIKLASHGYEYLVDSRPNQQLTSRRLAEALTRALGCDLVEIEDKQEIMIPAADLDLPFSQRVKKYPMMLGSTVDAPPSAKRMDMQEKGGVSVYSWGLWAGGLLTEILGLMLLALVLSYVKWSGVSIFDVSVAQNNYTYYYAVLALLFVTLFVLPGYRERVTIGEHDTVQYQVRIWGMPIEFKTIRRDAVEEIRQHEGLRGPIIQIISANKIIAFRVSDRQLAHWLAHQLGLRISGQKD